jgi:RNA polymerase sigma-70 factor, ECF subfamily
MATDPKRLTPDEFVERFISVQSRVYGYIATLAPNRADADELFQQTSLVLWRKREQFDPARDFLRWACGIAHNEIRNFRKQRRREKLSLSDAMVEKLAALQHASAKRLDAHLQWLTNCMERLSPEQRDLLNLCYLESRPINAVAVESQIEPTVLYKRLDRIRWALVDCMRSMERREERS